MSMQPIKTLWALMRRELWENPGTFKWAPLIIAGLILFFVVVALAVGARFDAELAFTLDAIRTFAQEPVEQRRLFMAGAMFSSSALLFQFLILLVLFYLAGSLYEDRKDRSILFWKSLPVSDRMTVTSKLLTACLLLPALYLAAALVVHLALLLIATGYGLAAGVNPLTTFWLPSALPKLWLVLASGLVIQALWLLPIYAWIMFCSSWAPRVPILVAIAIPLGASLLQHAWSLVSAFRMPDVNIGMIMLKRFGSGLVPTNVNIEVDSTAHRADFTDIQFSEEMFMNFSTVFGHLLKIEMWIGILIALALLAGAVWFRRRATDN
jgi:ABC-2 type transport system permease protein